VRTHVVWLGLVLPTVLCAQSREQEIALALSAAPPRIAAHAAVYVLTPTGYEKARDGSNGFTCLVMRDRPRTHPDEKGPVCYDPEGSRAIAPRVMAETRMRMAGTSEGEIREAIRRGLEDGTYRVPVHAGIVYMLSPHATGLFPETDRVVPVDPHIMVYAPYLRNIDIGGVPPKVGEPVRVPFVLDEGEFNAYIIIPMPRRGD
jgi:hypothetical protein